MRHLLSPNGPQPRAIPPQAAGAFIESAPGRLRDQYDLRVICDLSQERLTTVGDGDLKALALKTNLDGDAHHRVVIDHENARHDRSSFRAAVGDSRRGPWRD